MIPDERNMQRRTREPNKMFDFDPKELNIEKVFIHCAADDGD